MIAILIVATLGEQKIFVAAPGGNFADLLFAVDIALGRVDHIQTGIEGAVNQSLDSLLGHAAIADLGAAVAEHRHVHPSLTKNALFHRLSWFP